jgi:cytochrome c-type biogenesis protein CcmH
MIFGLLLTVLCSAAAVAISIPLIRRYENNLTEKAISVAVYRDQLKELEKDVTAGTISPSDADSSKIEIQRRLLAATRNAETTKPLAPAWKKLALVSSAGLVILGGVNLYAYMGSPELSNVSASLQTTSAVAMDIQQSPVVQTPSGSTSQVLPNQVGDMIGKLAQRLRNNPDDAEGWRMLGWSYFNTQKYQDSVDSYAKAVALEPDNIDYKSAYAESLVQAAQGIVTPSAQVIVTEVLVKNPKEERARFYDALGHEQAGDQTGALDRWLSLLADAPLDAPWRDDVKQRVADLGKATNRNVSEALALPSLPVSSEKQLGQADQNAVVDDMISKLAAKLDKTPKDRDGWAMMIRSRLVKGDTEGADQAFAKAQEIFKGDTATLEGLKGIIQSRATGSIAAAPAISDADKAAVLALPAADQQEMIKGMVQRLAMRLDGNPNDSEGWIKLMRAYMVMQDKVKANEAKGKALAAFSNDPENRRKIEAAALEIGVK